MAYAAVEQPAAIDNAAITALDRLVNDHAVENRILVAFQVATQAED